MGTIYEDVELLQQQMAAAEGAITTLQSQVTALQGSGVTVLAENTDLFTLGEGKYLIPDATVSATILNKPVESAYTAFVYVISGGNAGQLTMYYIPCRKGDATYYHNAYYQSAWGTWDTVNLIDSGWIDLILNAGISAYSEAQKPRYRRVGKEVFLSGVFTGITANDTDIAILPAGYRPSKKVILATGSVGQKINRIEILTDGVIRYNRSTIEPTIAENWHSIACSFSVE